MAIRTVAPERKRFRTEVICSAGKKELRREEYSQIREACLKKPDFAAEADDWSSAEQWSSSGK